MLSQPPVWLLGLPPVVETEHDGEGAGGQQLLIVVVIQAVSRRQCKYVANLFVMIVVKKQIKMYAALVGNILTSTLLHLLLM